MNIHFNNKNILDYFKSKCLIEVEFGSNLYGLKNKDSDTDIMLIYLDSEFDRSSCFKNHHQFQYKDVDNNIDYIICSLSGFIKNLCSGDSTINVEIVQSGVFKNHEQLFFLDEYKDDFLTYKVVKSFLGLSKRDLTDYNKQKTIRDKNKAIFHGVRGYVFAKDISFNKKLRLDVSNLIDYDEIMSIEENNDKERKSLSIEFQNSIKNLRETNNLLHDNGKLGLPTYLDPFIQQMIDYRIQRLHNDYIDDKYIIKFPEELKKLIYDSNEYGIKY